jgi:Tfp pilus assembly protein PilV
MTVRVARGLGRLRGDRGVALLEVLTASIVVLIAMLGLALMFSMGSSYVAAEGGERVALFLAQQRLEELRTNGLGRAITESEAPIPGFPGFLRSTTVTAGTDLDGSGDVPRIIAVSVRSLVRQAGPISVTAAYIKH